MKLCNHKRFSTSCIYHERKYYFFDNVGEVNGDVTLTICFYDGSKWRSDLAYIKNIAFGRELFSFAIKKGLTQTMPKQFS